MKNPKMIIVFALLILSTFFATSVFAQGGNYGLDATASAAQLPQNGDLASVLGNIIGTALSMISVLFFGLILYGGITWMLARGKSENTQKALDTIIAAIIGLVVILAAYAITNFVFDNVKSGVTSNTNTNNIVEQWCLTTEKSCIKGSGSPCSGTLYTSEEECNQNKTN